MKNASRIVGMSMATEESKPPRSHHELDKKKQPKVASEDNPVRLYLMQMSAFPMLSRTEELEAARNIESSRKKYREEMLANYCIICGAINILESIQRGTLRVDRTLDFSRQLADRGLSCQRTGDCSAQWRRYRRLVFRSELHASRPHGAFRQ